MPLPLLYEFWLAPTTSQVLGLKQNLKNFFNTLLYFLSFFFFFKQVQPQQESSPVSKAIVLTCHINLL